MQISERTTGCGLVNEEYLNKQICLAGWVHRRRDHGGLIFIDLRDRTGLMQLVFNPEFSKSVHEIAHKVRSEYVITVCGKVVERAAETINKDLSTGKWELDRFRRQPSPTSSYSVLDFGTGSSTVFSKFCQLSTLI